MEEQRIKKAAPQIWNDLKEMVTKVCAEMADSPVELRVQSLGINDLKINNPGNRRFLVLSFDPMVPCISCDGPMRQQVILMFEVNAQGTIVSLVDQGIPRSINQLVTDMIQQLVRT